MPAHQPRFAPAREAGPTPRVEDRQQDRQHVLGMPPSSVQLLLRNACLCIPCTPAVCYALVFRGSGDGNCRCLILYWPTHEYLLMAEHTGLRHPIAIRSFALAYLLACLIPTYQIRGRVIDDAQSQAGTGNDNLARPPTVECSIASIYRRRG